MDSVLPAPTEIDLSRLIQISKQPVRLLGYPLPMVVAEKTVTALQRGEANTRWRDFADVLTISRTHEQPAGELRDALEAVATFRGITLRPLLPALQGMPRAAQANWANWRRRQSHTSELPDRFDVVLTAVAAFVDPALDATTPLAAARWVPAQQTWVRGEG